MDKYSNNFRVGFYPHPDIYRGYQNLLARPILPIQSHFRVKFELIIRALERF